LHGPEVLEPLTLPDTIFQIFNVVCRQLGQLELVEERIAQRLQVDVGSKQSSDGCVSPQWGFTGAWFENWIIACVG